MFRSGSSSSSSRNSNSMAITSNDKRELVKELHRNARRNFVRRSTSMRGIADTIQADLVEMLPYAKCRGNSNMKYILVAINIFSKLAYARPLKSKSARDVEPALRSILDSLGHPIAHLDVDQGKEFYNETVKRLLCDRNINLYSTYTTKKASIVERFNRTLKAKMWQRFSFNGSYAWVAMLPELIAEYNDSKHRTIGMRPNDVGTHNEQHLLDTVYKYKHNIHDGNKYQNKKSPSASSARPKIKFKVGDPVRLSKYKHVFEKGYTPNWTAEVFIIDRVLSHNHPLPATYRLVDLSGRPVHGTVYAEELQLTKQPNVYLVERVERRRGARALVKWLGFSSADNSWINTRDLV